MSALKIKDNQNNWINLPGLKGDKGDKGDPGISPTIDSTLSQANQAADAKAVGDKIGDLKDDLSQIWSEQIIGMTPTERQKESVNLFKYAELVGTGKAIYSISNGKVVLTDSTNNNTYLIPVDGESVYAFTYCRSAVVVADREYTAVSQLLTYTTSVNSTGGKYIIFSFNPTTYPESVYSVTKPVDVYTIPSNWDLSEVEIETPQIFGMTPTGGTVISPNLFSKATLVASGKYVAGISGSTGKVYLSDSSTGALDTYLLPVDGISTYYFTHVRSGAVVTDLEYTPVGNSIVTNVTSIDSMGGKYILFSFNHNTYPTSSYVITKPVPAYYIPTNWVVNSSAKIPTDKVSGSVVSDGTMTIVGRSAIKDGQMIAFKGRFETFSGFTLNFFGMAVTNYIAVTETTITIKNNNTTPTPVNHGLTIQNEVTLTVEFIEGSAKISLYSMGNVYTQTVQWSQTGGSITQPQIKSDGTAFSVATLVISYDCVKRNIWYFGDSYIGSASPDRWCYYLKDAGFMRNLLLSGSAGGTSANTSVSLSALLKYGTPKYAVMATGMNDGSDGEGAPTAWIQRRDEFLNLCENNGITPIFCITPTVPTVNNEQKNAWVRASGYRYIDFASAVGADGTGAWYSGMLSGDNVHPTEKGAKALYTQVLIDLPEVTLK